MKIELKEIPIRDVFKGYSNNDEDGVVGYGGRLNIRPIYQREFIYKDAQRDSVIETIQKGFPLNVMYWSKSGDDTYEVLDGQQRTISFCEYVDGKFSVDSMYFHNLKTDKQEQILNYKLMIYFCDGEPTEKLDWFKIINIAGEKLSDQELRNAIYTGTWLTDAKRYFSKSGCPAYEMGSKYLKGVSIRQEYLATAIKWISKNKIEDYMSVHQHDANANELWLYFQNVLNWIEVVFTNYRKEMKGVDYGSLFNEFKDKKFNAEAIEAEIQKLMEDEDVGNKVGIYPYIMTRAEKHLNLRSFADKHKTEAFNRQKGICVKCEKKFKQEEMEADHIIAWSKGGKTVPDNCQMLCRSCNATKSNR